MSRYLPLILIAVVGCIFTACQPGVPDVEKQNRHGYGTTGRQTQTMEEPESTPKPRVETTETVPESVPKVNVEPTPPPMPTPVIADYPSAKPVEGKPGYVHALVGPGIVDVRGYPPGTEVTDPYSGKIFLVP